MAFILARVSISVTPCVDWYYMHVFRVKAFHHAHQKHKIQFAHVKQLIIIIISVCCYAYATRGWYVCTLCTLYMYTSLTFIYPFGMKFHCVRRVLSTDAWIIQDA